MAIAIVAIPLIAVFATNTTPQLGLDLQGGISVVLAPKAGTKVKSDTLGQAVKIIRSRVDSLGVAEPEVSRQGNNIIVNLPGVKDREAAVNLVGQTAELRFRPVLATLPPEAGPNASTTTTAPGATTTTAAGGATTTTAAAGSSSSSTVQKGAIIEPQVTTTSAPAATTTTAPAATTTTAKAGTTPTTAPATTPTTQNLAAVPSTPDTPGQEVVLPVRKGSDTGAGRLALGPELMTGKDVKSADARYESGQGWVVHLSFTGDGFNKFNTIAAQYVNKQIAIVLDGVVQSYPVIKDAKFDQNDVVISGNFKEKEAKDLALVLRYGSLPVQLQRQDAQTVSASLGKDSLRAGLIAGAVGTILVLLYMAFYYRLLGIVVLAGLGVWGSLQWSIISYLGKTQGLALSLAGVTGIVVSIGVTVDSYVVFFERLKDEIHRGSTIRTAVERGFRHAFRTILIADTSAFIGAATLYLLTVGPVRGFAFFLGLSTLLDVTVAWFFTRPLVALLARRKRFSAGSFIGAPAASTAALVGGGS
jgi:preprotein translocase subunit SecD